ncbi:MAG: lysoplasmalogenase [Nannocystaceae bacterium]|nr:lysoplasmalogenase [bacterium]
MIWLGLTLAALAALLLAERADSAPWIRRLKPLASAGFLGWALHNGALGSPYGTAIFAGLVLSWFGDVFLMSKRPSWFLAGLVAFLAAHVAYIVAFVGLDPTWSRVAVASVGLTVVAWRVRRWLRPTLPEGMKRPVDGYILVITAMVATAYGAWSAGASAVMLLGAVAFYLSDLSVARERFVASGFINRAWGLPMYYVAQLLLGSTC